MATNKPLEKFSANGVSAVIWQNTTKGGKDYLSVDLERGYKDKDDNWKNQKVSLFVEQTLAASHLLAKAYDYLTNGNTPKN